MCVEDGLKDWIHSNFPGEAIVAEESGGKPRLEGNFWTIDPIDGTTDFVHGLFDFSISLSRVVKDQVVLGVTYAPATDELFYGVKGEGAFVAQQTWQFNGEQISLRDIPLGVMPRLE